MHGAETGHYPDNPLASFVPYRNGVPLTGVPVDMDRCSEIAIDLTDDVLANGGAVSIAHVGELGQYPFGEYSKSWLLPTDIGDLL